MTLHNSVGVRVCNLTFEKTFTPSWIWWTNDFANSFCIWCSAPFSICLFLLCLDL